jgi:hypothetical protein
MTKTLYPIINEHIIKKMNTVPVDFFRSESFFCCNILHVFSIPDITEIENNESVTPEIKKRWAALAPEIALLLNNILQHYSWRYENQYIEYHNYEAISAKTHFYALDHFFKNAHSEYGSRDISICFTIIEKIKEKIAKNKTDDTTIKLIEEIKASDLNKIFNIL